MNGKKLISDKKRVVGSSIEHVHCAWISMEKMLIVMPGSGMNPIGNIMRMHLQQ